MKIATAGSRKSKQWRSGDTSWDNLLKKLRDPVRTGETVREYRAMTRDEQSARKDIGGFVGGALRGTQRKSGEVLCRSMLTLDADDAHEDDWEQVTSLLEWRMCVYSTHSHTPQHPRLRWIIPLKRDVTPEEYVPIARKVAEFIGIETMDTSTYQPERLMFWPSCPYDGEYIFHDQDGALLDPDYILRTYGDGEAWKDASRWPISSKETEVILREAKRQADPESKRGVVGAFCRVYDIPSAIDAFDLPYEECSVPGRYTYTGGSTAAGAVLYGNGSFMYSNHATDPAGGQLCNAFDLVRIHRFGDQDVGANVREGNKLPSYKAMCAFATSLGSIKGQLIEDGIGESFGDMGEIDAGTHARREPDSEGETLRAKRDGISEGETSCAEEEENDDWKNQLELNDKTGMCEPTLANATLLLRNLPAFKGKLGYNPMNDTITVEGELPWWKNKKDRNEAERLLDALAAEDPEEAEYAADGIDVGEHGVPQGQSIWGEGDWACYYACMEKLGFQSKGEHNGLLDNALNIVSQENSFHPIRSYLSALKWDGVPRVEEMFIKWLGAQDTELDRTITKLWMMAGVDRVMRPGCQFDQILITCGPQGIGKTKLLRYLARGFFTNSITALNMDKDTAEKLQGIWLVELGELDGMRKSGQTAIKNFITSTTDRYRSAYARTAVTHKRQCIFAGTSNEGSFLRDDSGERRYWIMPVEGTGDRGELRGFKDEVDQLWAEAVVMWGRRVRENRAPGQKLDDIDLFLYLQDADLEAQMEERRGGYKMPEEDRDDVIDYLNRPRPQNWYEMSPEDRADFAQGRWLGNADDCTLIIRRVSVKEIRCELFGERQNDCARKSDSSYRITDILDSLPDWMKSRTKMMAPGYNGGNVTTWVRKPNPHEKE